MELFVLISIPNTISNRHLRRVWLLGMQGRSRDRMVSRRMAPFVGYVQHRLQEMVSVLLAAATWGKSWAGQCVCFQSDNMAVVSVLRSGKAKTIHCYTSFAAYISTAQLSCSLTLLLTLQESLTLQQTHYLEINSSFFSLLFCRQTSRPHLYRRRPGI